MTALHAEKSAETPAQVPTKTGNCPCQEISPPSTDPPAVNLTIDGHQTEAESACQSIQRKWRHGIEVSPPGVCTSSEALHADLISGPLRPHVVGDEQDSAAEPCDSSFLLPDPMRAGSNDRRGQVSNQIEAS